MQCDLFATKTWTEFICTKFATNLFYYVRNLSSFSIEIDIELAKQEDKIELKTTDICKLYIRQRKLNYLLCGQSRQSYWVSWSAK